jgi:hypothetical protein
MPFSIQGGFMKGTFRLLAASIFALGSFAGLASAKNVMINPQAGVTATHYTSDPDQITNSARVGYSLGGNLRLGGKLYVSPGAYYQRTSTQITQKDSVTFQDIKDAVGVNAVYVPLKLGVNLSSNAASAGSFGLRLYGGPSMTMVTSVSSNTFGLTKADYEGTSYGLEAGAGLDISAITIDLSYEKGLSKVLQASNTKQQVIRATFGFRL